MAPSLTAAVENGIAARFSGPISPTTLVDAVLGRLESAIMAGKLAPGTRLSEQALAREFAVSRGAVREALRQLEGRKLVERITNIGARITCLSNEDVVENFMVWEALGGLAARLSTAAITEKEIGQLKTLIGPYRNAGITPRAVFDINHQFHRKIAETSGSGRLMEMYNGLLDVMHLYRFQLMHVPQLLLDRVAASTSEMEAVLDAMARRDPVQAEAAMRLHLASNLAFHRESVDNHASA